jgi:heme exporter protein B
MLQQSLEIFWLNVTIELRSRTIINTAIAFALSSLLTAIFALKVSNAPEAVKSGLIWLIILFAALNAISRLFISEREQKTLAYLRLNANAQAIYWGKLFFNYAFLLLFTIPLVLIYVLLLNLTLPSWLNLLAVVILGSLALASATTLLAAIVAESDTKSAIFAVISVPVLFPALLIAIELTETALFSKTTVIEWATFLPLIGFSGALLTAGSLLLESLWDA